MVKAMALSSRLKTIRQQLGLTLLEVSAATGIGSSSISEFEHEKREPSVSQLAKLAKVYEKSIGFFFEEGALEQRLLLWRNKPAAPEAGRIQARFEKLCEQYKNLENWTGAKSGSDFNRLFCDSFPTTFGDVESLAHNVWKEMALGDRPGGSLLRILEEVYGVKIFHLPLNSEASSACTWTEQFGPAIMLNRNNRHWRRNFDLAHELFHLVTWKAREKQVSGLEVPSAQEESFANTFASRILLPAEAFRDAINRATNADGKISYDELDSVARQFGVSLDALFWRLGSMCSIPPKEVRVMIKRAKEYCASLPGRPDDTPSELPQRYCALAIRALRHGEISSSKFASYVGIGVADVDGYTNSRVPEPIKIPVSHS